MFVKCDIIPDFARVQLLRDVEVPGGVFKEGTIMELVLIGNPPCTRVLVDIEDPTSRLNPPQWPTGIWYKPYSGDKNE